MNDDFEYRLFEATRMRHQQALNEFDADDDLVSQRFKNVSITVQDRVIPIVKPPTAGDAIENAADHILTNPRITVPVRDVEPGKRDEAERVSERRQTFHDLWWDRVFSECGDPLGYGKTQLVKGKLVLKKTLNWDAIPPLPENPTKADSRRYRSMLQRAGKSAFLWELELIPKETVFEDISEPWDPDYVFEAYTITQRDAIEMFPEMASEFGVGDPLGDVEYVEYWEKPEGSSRGKFIQWVNGKRAHESDNPYHWEHPLSTNDEPRYQGYVPYVIGDPGWGDTGPKAAPEDRYVSILRRARSVIEAEAQMLTTMNEYLKFYVFKPLKTSNIPDDKPLANVPGAVWAMQEGQDAEFMQPGDMPAGLLAGMGRVNSYADQTSKFSTLGGMPQRGVDTATEADQNIRNAATKLSGPIRTLRRMIIQINAQVAQDIENVLSAPVTLYGAPSTGVGEITLSPSDIDGFYLTYVELETSDEAALNLNSARTWSDLAQRLPISFKTAMRMAGIMNGSQEMDERTIENLEQSQPVMQALLAMLLQGIGAPQQPQQGAQIAPAGGALYAPASAQPAAPTDNIAAARAQAQADAVQNASSRSFR